MKISYKYYHMQIELYKITLYIELVIQSSCSAGNFSKNKNSFAVDRAGRQLTYSWHSFLQITSVDFLAPVQVPANKTDGYSSW